MPIFVKPEWNQTLTTITVKIPSHGVLKSDVDFVNHEIYIKAHYQQFIFELFLFKTINVSKSTCYITDTNIVFELTKLHEEDWTQIEADFDKSTKKELRKQIMEEIQQRTQQECEKKSVQKAELKREGVRLQIAEDTKKHELIKNLKQAEEQKALKELQLWEEKTESNSIVKDIRVKKEYKKSSDTSKYKSSGKKANNEKTKNNINASSVPQIQKKEKINQRSVRCNAEENSNVAIPLPRKTQTINISFTPREFPTPLRESRIPEEEEWLAKQAEARRSSGFDSKDLRPEERNPQWLKAKGDEFFKAKNYIGAISAYSEGINISKNFLDLYIARSAAHFEIGNLKRTIEDCSTAIEIMNPPVPANLENRIKCIARRGAALCKMGLQKEGIAELEAGLKLTPDKHPLKNDLVKIKMKFLTKE